MLNDLLKSMGISKTREPMDQDARPESSGYKSRNQTLSDTVKEAPNAFAGTVSLPSFEGLDNPANAGGKHSSARQAMLMRIDHLFEKDIDARLKKTNLQSPHLAEMLEVTFTLNDEDSRKRSMLNKPIVIGDAIPVPGPEQCHESVEQMLQAALAHHNLGTRNEYPLFQGNNLFSLGNYEESLKFLEASRVQVFEIEKYNMQVNRKKQLEMQRELELEQEGTEVDVGKDRSAATAPITLESIVIDDNDVVLPLDLEMYIMLCKGKSAVKTSSDSVKQFYLDRKCIPKLWG